MFIEQPPQFVRQLYPRACWRMNASEKSVYLTFDDGPIPEITPWVLDVLDKYRIKATFFMVGDNVRRYPELFEEIKHYEETEVLPEGFFVKGIIIATIIECKEYVG